MSANIPPQTAVPPVVPVPIPTPNVARSTGSGGEVPYFPPPPTAPLEPNEHLREEGAFFFVYSVSSMFSTYSIPNMFPNV